MTTTRDADLPLFLHDWHAPRLRARLLLVHGLGEHGGRYAALAADLNAAGVSVRAFDHRGHGRSPGKRGAIDARTPDCLARDAARVFADYASEGDDVPFLLGHSLGGLVAMHAVGVLGLRPRGLIASSPALASHAGGFDRILSRVMSAIAPGFTVSNQLPADRLSHAPDVARAYLDDPLNHDRISARLARWIFDAGPQVIDCAPRWPVPTLLQFAGDDHLVDATGARAFADQAPAARVRTREYAGLYHELYNEAEPARSEVVGDLLAWLDERITSGAAPLR